MAKTSSMSAAAIVAVPIYVNFHGEGVRGKNGSCPIHELPLIRKQYALTGDQLVVQADWLDNVTRIHRWTTEDYERARENLKGKYGKVRHGDHDFDLLTDVYGPGAHGLALAMKRVYDRYKEILEAGDEPTLDEIAGLEQIAGGPATSITIDLPGIMEDKTSDTAADLDAGLIDELKANGISAAKAREIAMLSAAGKVTDEALSELFKGNEVKVKSAKKALAAEGV